VHALTLTNLGPIGKDIGAGRFVSCLMVTNRPHGDRGEPGAKEASPTVAREHLMASQ